MDISVRNTVNQNLIMLTDNNILINDILKTISTYVNLHTLYLHFSPLYIKSIPKKIKKLLLLKVLSLNTNDISKIPKEIGNLTFLAQLDLSNNRIKLIPKEIKNLNNLVSLLLSNNKIKKISSEIFSLSKLTILNLSFNRIKIIPNDIRFLNNLEILFLTNNNITSIPNSIIYCRNLNYFDYENNEIENISPIIRRFLLRLHNNRELQVYNDRQNIHNHIIQNSIFNSIINIINQNFIINNSEIINNIIQDTILTEKTKNLLIEYCENKDIHSNTQLTFEELLCNVWVLINKLKDRDEIKTILNIEINDSECKCFTGRISRLVNSLNGFTDLVKINIADNQQIGNIIVIIKNKLIIENNYTIEKHKELVINELKEREFNNEIIQEWIDFIQ